MLNDVETYIRERPDNALAAIRAIEAAGFGSKSAYYAFKDRVQEKE